MEPLWVLLPFSVGAIPALAYLRSREASFPALRFWTLAWVAIWAAGLLVSLGERNASFYVLSNFIGPAFSALVLAGSYRFVDRPLPRWLLPVGLAICGIAGGLTLTSRVTGAVASSLLEAPLVALAGGLVLMRHPTPGLVTRWLGVDYLGLALLLGLDWIGQRWPETGPAVFVAWMGTGGTVLFIQGLAFAESFRARARRLTRERELLRQLSHVALDPDGTLGDLNAALEVLPQQLKLAGFGIWRLDARGELEYVAGHATRDLALPPEVAAPDAPHPMLTRARAAEGPVFQSTADSTMSEPVERAGFNDGFVAPLRAGHELVGVMGGVFETGALVTDEDRRLVSDLGEEIALVLAHFEIRRAQDQIAEQREIESRQLRAVIEAVPAGIVLLDQNETVLLMSPLFAQHTTCGAPETWLGRQAVTLREALLERVPRDSEERLREATRRDSIPADFEFKNHVPSLLRITSHDVTDESGSTVGRVWMVRDITEERRMAERIQFGERMQTVETLAGGLAHDFNNQLTTILGNASFLRQELDAKDSTSQTLVDIVRSAEHCAELTRGLLTFTRQDPAEVQPIRLAEVLCQVALLIRPSLGPEVEFDVALDNNLGWVDADASQLRRIVTNLLANARDAVQERGSVALSAGRVDDADAYWIEVRDDGEGMTLETQRRIFEPFFTTKETGLGTGLGLAIVYGIVERNGAHIEVTSEPGAGSCFRVTWPAREAPAVVPNPTPEHSTARGTVLLAEDEPSVRRLVCRALEQAGYQVEAVADGDAAVSHFRKDPRRIDLALLDLSMPGRTGLQALEAILEDAPDLPALIMSGHPDRENVRWPEHVAVLPKPFSPSSLVERVGELIERGEDRPTRAASAPPRS